MMLKKNRHRRKPRVQGGNMADTEAGCLVQTSLKMATFFFASFLSFQVPVGMAGTEQGSQDRCLAEAVKRAGDDVTIGELRARCQEQNEEPTVVDKRLAVDSDNVLKPYTLMAHKANYILLAAYNDSGYDATYFRQQYKEDAIDFNKTEAQFQISIKTPLAIGLFNKKMDIYAAYTNRSFWQVYKKDISSPFRETNHEPAAWLQFGNDWHILGFTNRVNLFGIVHQSNGQGGVLSRSWNRVYGNFILQRGNLVVSLKPWVRIQEDLEDDDNPDISDYLGHAEFHAAYKWQGHTFSAMLRNNVESNFSRGAVEGGWSFPLFGYPYMKGYVQIFSGYGESLIDYNHYVNRVGIGLLLSDLLL